MLFLPIPSNHRVWSRFNFQLRLAHFHFRFKLSYRDLVTILAERGLPISHTTILRWVVRYAETCEKRWSRFERPVGGSGRAEETFGNYILSYPFSFPLPL